MSDSLSSESPLSGSWTVVAAKAQVSAALVEGAVILNLETGVYFDLNATGARIWRLIQGPKTIDEIQAAVLEEYDVDPGRCERDVVELLRVLAEKRLIEIDAHDARS